MEINDPLEFPDREEWRRWLIDNHRTEKGCWLVFLKDGNGLEYIDAVEEAICFGWIDSTVKRIDETRRAQRFTPRSRKGNWTELNKERARRQIRLGRMTPAGESVLPDLDEPFVPHAEIMRALEDDEETYRNFMNMPELYIRVRLGNMLWYVSDENEFKKKITKFAEMTKHNRMYGEWNDKGRLLEK